MRIMALLVAIIGVALLGLGIYYIPQAASGKQEIADKIAPLTLDNLDAMYDKVSSEHAKLIITEELKIMRGAVPDAKYNYLTIQRTGLGLARAEVGLTNFILITGIVEIILGVALILISFGLMRKSAS